MKTFKVRVTGAGQARYWYANKIGQEFTVTDRNKGGYYIDGAGSRGLGGYIDKSDCVIVEDTMEYTKNGVTYRQLKDITVKALVLAGADDEYVEYFGMDYNITEQIWLRIAIDFSSRWPERLQWLVDQGFVEVVEERKIDIDQILRIGGIQKRGSGNLASKSAYLSKTFSWSIEIDDKGIQCLVPKHKR